MQLQLELKMAGQCLIRVWSCVKQSSSRTMCGGKRTMRVAVVGAGGGGLCALRHLMASAKRGAQHVGPVQFEATCFEQSSKVGGTWAYTDEVGTDKYNNPIHSSMYKNLKTNLPKECMGFPDYPFPSNLPSFMKHEDVQKYIEDYAEYFDLLQFIRFQRQVQMIRPILEKGDSSSVQWEVTTQCVIDPSVKGETEIYDAVIIGNGNYSVPNIPKLEGNETFQGQLMHSHNYRRPEPFRNQNVVVLGANSSGQDIVLELATVARKVYISHNKPPLQSRFPDNVEHRPGIARLNSKRQVVFLDGSVVEADTVLLCTGYHYDYSFLSADCGIQVNDFRVTPLYKHLINTKYPSMAIIGICKRITPFPFFEIQVKFFKAVLEGSLILPSESVMNEDTQQDYEARLAKGNQHRHSHAMDGQLFRFLDGLADMAAVERLPSSFEEAYMWAVKRRRTDVMNYKKMNMPKEIELSKALL